MRAFLVVMTALFAFACNNSGEKKAQATDSPTVEQPVVTTPPVTNDTIFSGRGTEPFWAVYVIKDNKIVLDRPDGNDIEVPFVAGTTIDSLNTKYTSTNESTTFELLITKKNCSDGMSDITYPYAVTVSINAVKYEGCGK